MKAFELGKMTLSSLFKKPETYCYPYERREPYADSKGHIENDVETCIFCGACERACPCGAIEVGSDAWTIDFFQCVQCGSCVRACPESCLTMAPGYPQVATSKSKHEIARPEQ